MNIRKWVYLFWTTLVIGGAIGGLIGLAFNWRNLAESGALNVLTGAVQLFGLCFMFSVISQMGFFAYLIVHRFGLSMFRSPSLWNGVLIVLTAFTLFDLFYFRQAAFRDPDESILSYIWLPLFLLAFGWVVSLIKQKETNRFAFIPTLFFMVVVTTVEWFPSLKTDNDLVIWAVLATLLASNTWQVLLLHRLIDDKEHSAGAKS